MITRAVILWQIPDWNSLRRAPGASAGGVLLSHCGVTGDTVITWQLMIC
jgi:hypothetical protein